ncbi:MAG: ZIP family metal transporter, partial [Phycisphaeraceae bacterium]
MIETFENLDPWQQALLAGLFTWCVTMVGASLVFFTRSVNRKLLDAMLGFAAGVMMAASFWSLLAPAIEISEIRAQWPAWLIAAGGFLLGAGAMFGMDRVIPHLHLFQPKAHAEGIPSHMRRSVLLVLAIAIHNFPEGLAVGVGFGGAAVDLEGTSLGAALALALGIGIQNFPEGIAVAMPLRGTGVSRRKSFFWGQASAIIEPIGAVLGAVVVLAVDPVLPWALAFAAGAMIYVVVEELIPESHAAGNV